MLNLDDVLLDGMARILDMVERVARANDYMLYVEGDGSAGHCLLLVKHRVPR